MSEAPILGGQGAPPPETAAAPPVVAPPASPAGPVIPWLPGADDVTVGYTQNKGWTEPSQLLDSYRNLEKLMGADKAGNAVVLPKPDATPQELDAFYNRLGRPATPEGYKIPVPEGMPKEFAAAAAKWFHEAGIPQKAGEDIAAKWNAHIAAETASYQTQLQAKTQQETQDLKSSWGAAHDQNLTIAQTAARGLGVAKETIDALEMTMGYKATMEFFHKIGSKIGEPDFATGGTTERFGAALTPGQALAKIAELKGDKNFVSRYVSGDASARAEMEKLHAFAFPPESR